MGEYFKPSRRKAGCVLLVMAFMLFGAWMRSRYTLDVFTFTLGPRQNQVISWQESVCWVSVIPDDHVYRHSGWMSESFKPQDMQLVLYFYQSHLRAWDIRMLDETYQWDMPYWSLVTPLTAISAFLLLSKPCKSTQKKLTDPIPAEGA